MMEGKIMENKEMNFSGKGILTVITGIIIMGSTIATLSSYFVGFNYALMRILVMR